MPTTGRMQKPWEGHGWVMYAMRVQAVVIVETLQQRSCFSIWLGKGGGVQGWQEGSCREDAQEHRTGKKRKTGLIYSKAHKNAQPPQASHRPHMCRACPCACVCCRCGCGSGVWMSVVGGWGVCPEVMNIEMGEQGCVSIE